MKYKIISTGNTILADLAFVEAHHAGDYEEIVEAAAPVARPALTKLAYMNRFTDAELAGIYTAAKSVVQVEVWLEKFKLAEFVSLDDPQTLGGLQALEAAGLLAAGRAAEIAA